MAHLVFQAIENGNKEILDEFQRVIKDKEFVPKSYKEIVNQVFVTSFLGTKNSSEETTGRAKRLAQDIGSLHLDINIDEAYDSIVNIFKSATGKTPKYEKQGGTYGEDLALQNIQARIRMVVSYLLAQLVPWSEQKKGFLLVLGTSNIDEGLRGYMTKYDCSAADINPIGGINKSDIKRFLIYSAEKMNLPVLQEIADAYPSAELRPFDKDDSSS